MTAQAIAASMNEASGDKKKTVLSAPAGTTTSLTTYYSASARVCNSPHGPTTLGPRRI